MTYPPVIQYETRALEAEDQARLARERRAARAPKRTTQRWGRLRNWLPLPAPREAAQAGQSSVVLEPCDSVP